MPSRRSRHVAILEPCSEDVRHIKFGCFNRCKGRYVYGLFKDLPVSQVCVALVLLNNFLRVISIDSLEMCLRPTPIVKILNQSPTGEQSTKAPQVHQSVSDCLA